MGISVILAGATGAVGQLTLEKLLAAPEITNVQVLTRRPLPVKHPKLTECVTDFSDLESVDLRPAEVFLCALGTTIKQAGSQEQFYWVDKTLVERCAKLACANGARTAGIISCIGASAKAKGLYLRTKGEMEQALKTMEWNSIFFLQPSLLLGDRAEFRLGESLAAAVAPLLNPLLFGPLKAYRAIPIESVARSLASIAIASADTKAHTSAGVTYWRHPELISTN